MPSQKLFAVSRTFFTYAPTAPGVWRAVVTFSATKVPLPVGGEVEAVAGVAEVARHPGDEQRGRHHPRAEEEDPVRRGAHLGDRVHQEHPTGDEDDAGKARRHQVL